MMCVVGNGNASHHLGFIVGGWVGRGVGSHVVCSDLRPDLREVYGRLLGVIAIAEFAESAGCKNVHTLEKLA